MTVYLRRNGGMVFWRVGRIGGSFYLSNEWQQSESREKQMRKEKRKAMRRELSWLRMERYRQLQRMIDA